MSAVQTADNDFSPASINVSAKNATPEAALQNIQANESNLQQVNSLSGGAINNRGRGRSAGRNTGRNTGKYRKNTYSRRFIKQSQQTGGQGPIIIPQGPGQASCSEGPGCAGAVNADLTSTINQAKSNSLNDGKVGGGFKRRNFKNKSKKYKQTSCWSDFVSNLFSTSTSSPNDVKTYKKKKRYTKNKSRRFRK